jgi:hypothetical protein
VELIHVIQLDNVIFFNSFNSTHLILAYGLGYAWNRPFLTVKVGDYVKWTWNAPALISTSYKVEQVQDALSDVPIGFTSGDSTSTG